MNYFRYNSNSDEVEGPFTIKELERMSRSKKLSENDSICDESEEWVPFQEKAELWEVYGKALKTSLRMKAIPAGQTKAVQPQKKTSTEPQNENKKVTKSKKTYYIVGLVLITLILIGGCSWYFLFR